MKEFIKNIKFEHVFAIGLLVILSIALFVFRNDRDLVMVFATALVGAFASVTTFFFTKYHPQNQNFISNDPVVPQVINPTNTTNDMK